MTITAEDVAKAALRVAEAHCRHLDALEALKAAELRVRDAAKYHDEACVIWNKIGKEFSDATTFR